MTKPSLRLHDDIIAAVVEAIMPDFDASESSSYYDPLRVNHRERARRIIGKMPFTSQIALAQTAHDRRFNNNDEGLEDTPLGHALEAIHHAVMLTLAFEDAPDATQAKARSVAVLAAMTDKMRDLDGLHMPDHWRDDAMRTIARDMDVIAAASASIRRAA